MSGKISDRVVRNQQWESPKTSSSNVMYCCNLFRKDGGDDAVRNDALQESSIDKYKSIRANSYRSLPRNHCCNKRLSLSQLEDHQRSRNDVCLPSLLNDNIIIISCNNIIYRGKCGCHVCDSQKGFFVKFSKQVQKSVPRLMEPRGLYGSTVDQIALHPARWPVELEVISEDIRHIRTVPNYPEPFYYPQSHDAQPVSTGKERYHVVYSYTPHTLGYFLKSCVHGHKSNERTTVLPESTLLFESRFESGNLEKAIQISDFVYELHLRSDLYTTKNNQWFYFMIRNTRAGVKYRFIIANLQKPNSLYNMGMKPLFYSETDAIKNNIGWTRVGSNISYYRNDTRLDEDEKMATYSLTFCLEFPHDNDTVYFAHCYPYTYTMLQRYLQQLQGDSFISTICKQRVLCRSLAGNYIYILTITSPGTSFENSKKKVVVITARVHPGETNSSYMLEGIVNCLTENSPLAKILREQFIFKIVPMLNPDGVIIGNTRCSLSGRDLNRCYRETLRDSYPSIWYTKQLIRRLMADHEVIMYCDLHGHSRKHNVFVYGCENKKNPSKRYHEQLFPLIFQHTAQNHFSYNSCKFKVLKNKEGTGRVVIWQFGIVNSFTIEISFCGSSLGKKAGYHFNSCDFQQIGEYFCKTLHEYSSFVDSASVISFKLQVKRKNMFYLLERLR
ncbi:Cytosolic carboxypeptidase 2 [Nymphon striatum]|nr:Cytosolic carboxypeptidase 2 [Nymphon striatum]